MRIKNPRAGVVGNSPHEPAEIEVDLFSAIQRYIDARVEALINWGGDATSELIEAEKEMQAVLDILELRIIE